jgi:hypothetical protein
VPVELKQLAHSMLSEPERWRERALYTRRNCDESFVSVLLEARLRTKSTLRTLMLVEFLSRNSEYWGK